MAIARSIRLARAVSSTTSVVVLVAFHLLPRVGVLILLKTGLDLGLHVREHGGLQTQPNLA